MNPDEEEQRDELEVTGEGTAGGPFGLKKVLFVRKKSEKSVASKEVKHIRFESWASLLD